MINPEVKKQFVFDQVVTITGVNNLGGAKDALATNTLNPANTVS